MKPNLENENAVERDFSAHTTDMSQQSTNPQVDLPRGLTTCPSTETLNSFCNGELPYEYTEAVAEHLEGCERCQSNLAHGGVDDSKQDFPKEDSIEGILGALSLDASPASEPIAELRAIEKVARWSLPLPPQVSAPERLREYQLLQEIGRGGMGTVYLAIHTRLKKKVAIKVLSTNAFQIPGAIERFEHEMQALGKLNHPNIVQASDAGVCEDTHFLVMEFIEGCNLAQWIKQNGRMSVNDVCSVLRQTCSALQAAHEHGLVHRDVKPSNIMLVHAPGQPLTVKLLDLGLAKLYEGSPSSEAGPSLKKAEPEAPADNDMRAENARAISASASGSDGNTQLSRSPRLGDKEPSEQCIVGTFDYMAPEQAIYGAAPSAQMDLYSLGCTCFHLLVGKAPFRKPNATKQEKLSAHANQPVPRVSEFRNDVPDWLTALVSKLMAKRPSDRPRSAADVVLELDRRRREQHRRHWLAGLAIAVMFFSLALGAILYRIKTDSGTLEITPLDEAVQVVIEQNGQDIKVIDTKTNNVVELHSGEFTLKVANRSDVSLDKSTVQLKRGEKVVVQLKWVSPGQWTDGTRELPEESFKQMEKLANLKKHLNGELTLEGVIAILGEPIPEESLLRLPIKNMEVSPDGKKIALVTSNYGRDETTIAGELILLDSRDGRVLHRLQPHTSGINKVAWTPDSQVVLTAGIDGQLVMTNVTAGKAFRRIELPPQVDGIAVSQNGQLMAAACKATVYIIRLSSGEILHRLKAEGEGIYFVAFRGNSELLSNGFQSPNHVWDLSVSPPSVKTFRKYRSLSSDLFVPKTADNLLWTAGYDGRCILWNTKTGHELAELPHQWVASSISANSDNSLALTTEWSGATRIWDTQTQRILRVICSNGGGVVSRFFPDGKGVIAAGADGIVHAVDATTGESLWSKAPHRGIAIQVTSDSEAGLLASAAADGSVALWDAKAHKLIQQLRHFGGRAIALEFRDRGKRLIAVTNESFVTEWNLETNTVTNFDLAASAPNIRTEFACIDDAGRLIAMARAGGGVDLWDCQAKKLVGKLANPPAKLSKIEFTTDGKHIWGVDTGKLLCWDVLTGDAIAAPKTEEAQSLGRVGKLFLAKKASGTITAYRENGDKAFEFQSPYMEVSQFVANSDGTRLMLVSHPSNAASIWNLTSEQAVLQNSLILSPPEIATNIYDVAWDEDTSQFYAAHFFGIVLVGSTDAPR